MLIARINNEEETERIRRLPVRLDVRQSCGALVEAVVSAPVSNTTAPQWEEEISGGSLLPRPIG